MRRAGVPADVSDAAGTFVCNHLLYGMLHHIATNDLPIRAGWIHLPHLPSVAALERNLGALSMSVDTAVTGVAAGIEAALEHRVDVTEPFLPAFRSRDRCGTWQAAGVGEPTPRCSK